MHEPRFGPHMLGEMGQERDHVVLGDGLDLVDPRHVELHIAGGPDLLGGRLRDHAQRRLGVAGMGLDLEPDPEPGLR